MLTAKDIEKANEGLSTIDVKGKEYVQVNTRVAAFRKVCPSGSITTEIVSLENGVVTMKTTITDEEGRILSTGFAQEKESGSYINKTSYIENCETSACGRALGFLGIGIDGSMCSAEELVNAINNQNMKAEAGKDKIGAAKAAALLSVLNKNEIKVEKIYELHKVKDLKELTEEQHANIMANLEKIKAKE